MRHDGPMTRDALHGWLVFTRLRSSAVLHRLGSMLEVPQMPIGDRIPAGGDDRVQDVSNPARQPYITEFVHFQTWGHPTGEPKACRPALVVELVEGSDTGEVELAIFRRNGLQFDRCRHEEDNHLGGTWHFAHA
jgi:hypothetical protein